jgi:hypothetical protein
LHRDHFVRAPFRYPKKFHLLHLAHLVVSYLLDVSDVTFSPGLVARNADRVVLVGDAFSGKRARNYNRSMSRKISKKFWGKYNEVIIICAPRMLAKSRREHHGSDRNPTHLRASLRNVLHAFGCAFAKSWRVE